ncbi:ExbD/TolR family protein [Anatilimnocola floriformis]|uniref:ExbD/TolR family protein n=1 Tax=Anatilimnocola floriformis TaxID=2948575 RepID=UPI0020C51CBF|nr:biopolymer transporter ExbD [Anatilimnocola floriformis]
MSGGHEGAEPDLVPMLDMVFQLITFFMLVINFKAAAMDLDLKLPVVGSARPVEGAAADLLVLNVNDKGELRVYGALITDVEGYLKTEAMASLAVAQRTDPSLTFGKDLPSTVVIRADKRTPFALLNKVVKTCQDYGYRSFALKAMNKAEGG